MQYAAVVTDTSGAVVDTTVAWAVLDTSIGSIDQSGLFSALSAGSTNIVAAVGAVTDTASVIMSSDAPPAEGSGFTVAFSRVKSDGKITKFGKTVQEGVTKTLGGIPHPLNFLNGGKLFFPENSLSEDITISIKLPEFAKDKGDKEDVDFVDSIAVAVTFEVSVNDSVISPYAFGVPLELNLPYKKGLLDKLGIDPLDLGMFFITPSGALDSAGITDAVLDEESNKISAKIAHFSDIGLAEKSGSGQSAQIISSIEISPESATLTVGDSAQFTAVVTDTAGATIDTTVTWSVSGGIGSVSESGNFTAETAGSGFVTAQVGSVSDSVAVTVTAPAEPEEPVVSAIIGSIVISPADTTVGLQDSLQLQATVSDTSGANVDTVVTWAVLDTTVGTIDQDRTVPAVIRRYGKSYGNNWGNNRYIFGNRF